MKVACRTIVAYQRMSKGKEIVGNHSPGGER